MKKKVFALFAAVLLIAALTAVFVACDGNKDNGNGVDLTEYYAILERLDAAGYSVTGGEGTSGADMVATGQFAGFSEVNVNWSIYGYKMTGTGAASIDMACIVCFASEEDAAKYEKVMVDMINKQLASQGVDISFDSLAELMEYYNEMGISVSMTYEMRGNYFVYAMGSGASDAFGE